MKSMLITASAVGVAIAGLILYIQRKNKAGKGTLGTASRAYRISGNGHPKMERPAQHAMG